MSSLESVTLIRCWLARKVRRKTMTADRAPEQDQAVVDFFVQVEEAVKSEGRHAGHELEQAGRCVYCSCGFRIGQARLSDLRRAVLENGG
jgi:hypothetical protein